MISRNTLIISSFLLSFTFLFSCSAQPDKVHFKGTDTYDFADPKIVYLPSLLDEISGVSYYAKDTSVFAIVDEDGLLYKISLKNPDKIKEWRYDKARDFEDVVLKDSVFYVLVSNGDIDIVSFIGDKINTEKMKFPGASKKNNEFESLYYDAAKDKMIEMCKQCEDDEKKRISSFSLDRERDTVDSFAVTENTQILKLLGEKKEHVKPSAAAINPVTKDLYVLCSVNKFIYIQAPDGTIKNVIRLNPKIYKQPEGITFTPDGDMIISNERFNEGSATLLLLKNKLKH